MVSENNVVADKIQIPVVHNAPVAERLSHEQKKWDLTQLSLLVSTYEQNLVEEAAVDYSAEIAETAVSDTVEVSEESGFLDCLDFGDLSTNCEPAVSSTFSSNAGASTHPAYPYCCLRKRNREARDPDTDMALLKSAPMRETWIFVFCPARMDR